MQVVDYSKKYELPEQCGNHAEIFPKNIFCVISGATGCGKTNLMVNLLLQEQKMNYSDVYIYSPTIHQPAYVYLRETYESMEKIIKIKTRQSVTIAHFYDPSDEKTSLIDPIKLDKNQNHVMVFDDVMLEDQTMIKKYFCSGRHNKDQSRAKWARFEQSMRWVEHFREVLNQPAPAALFDLEGEPTTMQLDISESEITTQEVLSIN